MHNSVILGVLCGLFLIIPEIFTNELRAQNTGEQPIISYEARIYADFDTLSQKVYVLFDKELWSYNLEGKKWNFEARFDSLPAAQGQLEFGINPVTRELNLWSAGVGKVYKIDIEDEKISRLDRSFNHKNQFGHVPFFRNGNIYAYGGYGLWQYKSILTNYSPELREWTLVNVQPDSPVPMPRIGKTGFYHEEEDAFYVYGGSYSAGNHPDDKYVNKEESIDVWKYSFKEELWEYQTQLSFDNWEFEYPHNYYKTGKGNLITTSVFSPVTKNWYLPFRDKNGINAVFHFVAYNIESREHYQPVEIPVYPERTFLLTNYLFNDKTSEFVFVGVSHLTNQRSFPVHIFTLHEDSLLQRLEYEEAGVTKLGLILSIGGLFIIVLFLLFKPTVSNQLRNKPEVSDDSIGISELFELLNFQEKRLLEVLKNEGEYLESHDLEEKTWPDITNYDYRRKMRNETINSLNNKFKKESGGRKAIDRKKDPNDKRRYLYGLDEKILEALT